MRSPPLRHLYPRLTSFASLHAAARRAQRGKRYRPAVLAFNANLEAELLALQEQLRGFSYRPGPYRQFRIREVLGEQMEALEAAQLDQVRDQQPVEQLVGSVASGGGLQAFGVRTGLRELEPAAAALKFLQDKLEMRQLLDRDGGKLAHERFLARIAHDQSLGRSGGLQLAVRVIGQQARQVALDLPDPFGRRGVIQSELRHCRLS